MTTNLKSLALALGMSKTTVSRALNGYPEVNANTREKVLAAAQALGYQANPVARSLALGRTNIFGIIYPLAQTDLGDPMFLNVVGAMAAATEERGMNMIVAPVSPENEMRAYDQMLRGRRVDGLVVARTLVYDQRIEYLAKQNFPFVAHGRTVLGQPYAWFDYDHDAGVAQAIEYLVGLGHERIAMISAQLELNFAQQRREAFLNAMHAAGFPVDPRYLVDRAHDRRSGYQAVQRLLACSPRPTAIVVDNHLSGIGAVRALLDAGIKIGEEMSVIVWGPMEDTLVPHVTVIDQPGLAEAGRKMVEMLAALRDGTAAAELQVLWQPILRPGTTTGPAPR
ncbi:LacI family transcriptional regulator [Massilia arenosa]|uniref:LacI family transcriptional regulator n=1 Tax=Zemynaea arenosa TaxID=2561931 RepID=A0A4Y9SYG0_9BURK|nr:substrate-binding domain-containing protein [Massilia arenosa]TFW29663.1 LacI family transcriptional regulator [Massilia arenosa]